MRKIAVSVAFALMVAAAALVPQACFGLDFPSTMFDYGKQVDYSSATVAVGTHSLTGLLLSLNVRAYGGAVTFTVKYGTSSVAGCCTLVEGSPFTALAGERIGIGYQAPAWNPEIYFSSIATGATGQIDLTYLAPRTPASGAASPRW